MRMPCQGYAAGRGASTCRFRGRPPNRPTNSGKRRTAWQRDRRPGIAVQHGRGRATRQLGRGDRRARRRGARSRSGCDPRLERGPIASLESSREILGPIRPVTQTTDSIDRRHRRCVRGRPATRRPSDFMLRLSAATSTPYSRPTRAVSIAGSGADLGGPSLESRKRMGFGRVRVGKIPNAFWQARRTRRLAD